MLISPEYQKQQEELHETTDYGVVAEQYGPLVSSLIDAWGIDTVLDYGCGHNLSLQKTLAPERAIQYQAYDPAVPDYAGTPIPSQMVVCIDVLEHIEPECLEDVLDHLEELTEVVLVATVHCGPAGKTLSDGRNAHLIQQKLPWWLPKFWTRFTLQLVKATETGFIVICQKDD